MVIRQQRQPDIKDPRKQTSFLSLPIELRIAIYDHLIPNANVASYGTHTNPAIYPPFRHDKQPCCPAILRTNRQIYNEVIGMWYGTAKFGMYMTGRHLYFLGTRIHDRNAKLPSSFRFVRSLSLDIMLQWPREQSSNLLSSKSWTNLIAECLSTGPYNLRQVTLYRVKFSRSNMPVVIDSCLKDRGKQFKSILEQNLGPLRIIRGVNLKFDEIDLLGGRGAWLHGIILESGHPSHVVLRVFGKLQRIRTKFLQSLAEQVSQECLNSQARDIRDD